MKTLEDFITFEFIPEKGNLVLDNDHMLKGKVRVFAKQSLKVSLFTCRLNQGLYEASRTVDRVRSNTTILANTIWQKNTTYEYDIALELPQDYFTYKGKKFNTKCAIEFLISLDNESKETVRSHFVNKGKFIGLVHTFGAFSKEYQMNIKNEGDFSILPSKLVPKSNPSKKRLYIGLGFLLTSIISIVLSFYPLAITALIIALPFLIMEGYRSMTLGRLGIQKVVFDAIDSENHFSVNLNAHNLSPLNKISYNLYLEEVATERTHRNIETFVTLLHKQSFKTLSNLNNTMSFNVDYPENKRLPGSLQLDYMQLTWSVAIKFHFKNGLTCTETFPVNLIKTLNN